MLRDYLVLQLTAPEGGLQTSGVALDLGGGQHCLLFAKLQVLLSDGDGLRLALQWMGQGCMKPCFRHRNVFRKGSDMCPTRDDYVEITCGEPAMMSLWREGEFREAIDFIVDADNRRMSGEITKAKLEQTQRTFGFRATGDGLLSSSTLRPLMAFQDVLRYDWVHTFLQDGLVTNEAWLLISGAENAGVASQQQLHDFLKEDWIVPMHRRHKGRSLQRVFDEYGSSANTKHEKLKCSASELISLYPLLRHFVEARLPEGHGLGGKIESFRLACSAVDIILLAKRGDLSMLQASHMLRNCLKKYMAAHVAEYGHDHIKPKTHWAFDICDQLAQDPWLFDAFVIERLHLRVKSIAENVKVLRQFEVSVLSGVLNAHARRAAGSLPGCGLLGRTISPPGEPEVLLSDHLELNGKVFAVGDCVLHGRELGSVVACCCNCHDLFIFVDTWARVSQVSQHSSKWERSGSRRVCWRAADVQECVCWQCHSDGSLTLILL